MIRKCSTYAISTALLVLSSSALAQVVERGDVYMGAQLGVSKFDAEDADQDIDDPEIPTFNGRLGAYLSPYVSLEGRIGTGIGEDTFEYDSIDYNLEIDSIFGGYARAHLPVVEFLHVYAIGGITSIERTLSVDDVSPTISDTKSDTEASWGAGIDYHAEGNFTLTLEVMQYSNDEPDLQTMTIGLAQHF